ncbi:hypothetical protein E1091_16495, partial [Micromonospora fluostatini]
MTIFPLRVRVLIAPGADLATNPGGWPWRDITPWVRAGVRITRGRADDTATTQPGSCSLTLRSPAGRWMPGHPLSPEYPGWDVGCPLRVQVWWAGQWYTRYTGLVAEIEPTLPDRAVGKDSPSAPFEVGVLASGLLRRVGQGSAVRSPLLRLLGELPLDGWLPLEDGPGVARPEVRVPGQPRASATLVTYGVVDGDIPGAARVVRMDATTSTINMTVGSVGAGTVASRIVSTVGFFMTSPSLDT